MHNPVTELGRKRKKRSLRPGEKSPDLKKQKKKDPD